MIGCNEIVWIVHTLRIGISKTKETTYRGVEKYIESRKVEHRESLRQNIVVIRDSVCRYQSRNARAPFERGKDLD